MSYAMAVKSLFYCDFVSRENISEMKGYEERLKMPEE
jgi:hypothetical protein